MPSLNRDHRRLLENTVAQARAIAVDGARKVLTDQYAVHHHEPWPHMTTEERELRNQLRAHGRQLGDRRDDRRDTQEIEHLVQACAYEHWHRMLFARFLAENDLLLDADHGMAMSLDEVRELAREQNRDWLEIAAELAQKMLLAVFRPDDPVLRVSLPPETRQQLEEKLATLPGEIFRADDSLGWVYQFWQKEEKERVNISEVKIGADELPAVTQLFTEDYMVLFLLENTLGAWWTAKRRAERKDPVLPGYQWTYLRLNEDGSPAAGAFDGWPHSARELRVLDPSMGSGHFLTCALPLVVRMRVEEEGLTLQNAVVAVLQDNLYGLELDARCSQIAAFNLALAAWRLAGEHFALPELNLACTGLGINAPEQDWVKLVGPDGRQQDWMRRLYAIFRQAPLVGSLIDPTRVGGPLFANELDAIWPYLEQALGAERHTRDADELAICARGLLAAVRVLASRFHLVATNVPYLGRGKHTGDLCSFCDDFYGDSKTDLATSFVERCRRFCDDGGTVAVVTKQELLFQTSYKDFRRRLLRDCSWQFVARLGEHAFQSSAAAGAFVMLFGFTNAPSVRDGSFLGWDHGDLKGPSEKAQALRTEAPKLLIQLDQLGNPESRIVMSSGQVGSLMATRATSQQGIKTGDDSKLRRYFWELPALGSRWKPFQSTVEDHVAYGGRESVIDWQLEGRDCARLQGLGIVGKPGVIVSQMRDLPSTIYSGDLFDSNVAPIVPHNPADLPALWAFCSSDAFRVAIRALDPKVAAANATFTQVPFDLSYWQTLASELYPNGIPSPDSADPSQWLFGGNPINSEVPLHVAVCRLLGYQWPRQTGSAFSGCPTVESDRLDAFSDNDGIVCLTSIAGEASAADRLREVLSETYGTDWSAGKLAELLDGCESLEVWLRDKFFEQHCSEMFDHRPFIWHIWDGRKDGFHALVNYHKLAAENGEGRKVLDRLVYTYLGDWVRRQRADVDAGREGADARLVAALHLKEELEKILAGEKPHDIFVRWKPLHEQPIGWAPDINDGVRINIRPWLTAKPYQPSRRDSCILRVTPRMNYGKDRGRELYRPKEDFPWFWTWDEQTHDFLGSKDFDGTRWNDLHYSLETKRDARLRAQSKGSSK